MNAAPQDRATRPRPWRLFLTLLAIIFASEAVVMLLLPSIVPRDFGYLFEVFVDSFLLTSVLAPLLWWIVIVPLRDLVESRLRLLHRVFTVQEEERSRIARDLHDGVGQAMTALLVRMRAIEEASRDEKVVEQIRDMRKLGSDAYDQIRQISRGLRPTALDDFGLAPAIERFLGEAVVGSNIKLETDLAALANQRLPEEVETHLYRVIQEAAANALRHGRPSRISLAIQLRPGGLDAQFEDDGEGFDASDRDVRRGGDQGLGLWSMRERLAALQGALRVESKRGAGTIIKVHIPKSTLEQRRAADSSAHRR